MINLINNGKSDYVIVVGNSKCEKFAASELKDFIKKSTGVSLVITEAATTFPYISVGETSELEKLKFVPEWTKDRKDSFFCFSRNRNIFLCGKRDRGTLYAVYDFLEKFFGVRFFAKDEIYVPNFNVVNISDLNYIEEPSFEIRSFYTVQMENDSLYTARLRQVALYCEEKEEYGYGLMRDGFLEPHNVFSGLDVDKLRQTNPEYFCCCDIDGGVNYDLCYSQGINEDGNLIEGGIADMIADVVIKRVQENPEKIWFSVCQNDIPKGCGCAKCQENLKKYSTYSAILLRFINAVADKVERWRRINCPDREIRIVTFAYAYTLDAPKPDRFGNIIKPAENVWIWIASTEQNLLYSCADSKNSQYLEVLKEWQRVTDRFCFWDYRINFAEYLLYFPGLRYFHKDFAFLENLGVDYIFCEAASGSRDDIPVWLNEIKGYVAAKLMWNTKLDITELTEDFCTHYYGKYAKDVLKVIDLFEDNYDRLKYEKPDARIYLLLGYRTCESDYYPAKMLTDSIEIIKNCISDCTEQKLLHRLKHVLLTPMRMLLRNFSDYYPSNEQEKQSLYKEFVSLCEELNVINLGGWDFTLENLKKYPDYNWWKMNKVDY